MNRLVFRAASAFAAFVYSLTLTTAAFADVPPHPPGTVCYTPQFWRWAQPPGPPGYPCACSTSYGYVPGVLG